MENTVLSGKHAPLPPLQASAALPDPRIRQGINSAERGLTFWGQWVAAMSLVALLLCVLALHKTGTLEPHYRMLAVLTVLASVPVYSLFGVYHKQHGPFSGLVRLGGAWLTLLSGLIVLAFVTKTSTQYSREVILTWAALGLLIQATTYLPLSYLSRRYHAHLRALRTTLILGTSPTALELAQHLIHIRNKPVVGFVTLDRAGPATIGTLPVLGAIDQLRELIERHHIRRLYIALPLQEAERIQKIYIDLLDAHVDVVWIPDLHSMMLLNHSVTSIGGMPAIHLNESPLTAYPTAALLKAAMDRSVALVTLIAISPLLLIIAALVKLSSPGPVLFKQRRHGWNGRLIEVWKFRSMRIHHDPKVRQATRDDPRITPIGRFLRRTSLDELPQFFNVLQGHMSLVGPRPHALAHNDYYTGKINAYMARHRIKPGITGLAQVSGCRGETETLEKMQKRVELDLAYINNWSLWLDIKILLKTPFTLLAKDIY